MPEPREDLPEALIGVLVRHGIDRRLLFEIVLVSKPILSLPAFRLMKTYALTAGGGQCRRSRQYRNFRLQESASKTYAELLGYACR